MTIRNLARILKPSSLATATFSVALASFSFLTGSTAYGEQHAPLRDVVLVNDCLSGSKSWDSVKPLLEEKGFRVTIVALPLSSLKDDVETVEHTLGSMSAPVLLVGHGYGGVVITAAGSDPKVARLVYVAAYAPDDNQSAEQITAQFPSTAGAAELQRSADGRLVLSVKGVDEDLAQDLSPAIKADLVSGQRSVPAELYSSPVEAAAWRQKPSWFIVATNDRMIAPQLQRGRAKVIHANVTELQTGHIPMLSKPAKIAEVIEIAASGHRSHLKPILVGIGTMGMSAPFYH